jgi:hypothetical protein
MPQLVLTPWLQLPLPAAGEAGLKPPDSGYPLGWESLGGGSSRLRPVWHNGRATVANTSSPIRSDPGSTGAFG